ncbi:uncharacterized protein LOC130629354 isoform X2 [Hydractinia symbiolongicarpus]|uniref:uncharacterized protein LOC130629354 isoform X2 n=1 Tax=Hydractinia symbiolongicarpus TaxID=13093 RepID=UPI00254CCBE3|nr:uncharacterized protein LOC130629354 isoform X2 [Hydractinia symbiolongicarpus]
MALRQTRKNSFSNQKQYEKYCLEGVDQDGFEKFRINEFIGFGIFAVKRFEKKMFLLEYPGEVISSQEGKRRCDTYDATLGSYLFFYNKICIDATFCNRLGKFVNDSIKPNCAMKGIKINGQTHLCLFALRDIEIGEEIRYNYNAPGLLWRKTPLSKKVYNLYHLKKQQSEEFKQQSIANEEWECTYHSNIKEDIDFQCIEKCERRHGIDQIIIEPEIHCEVKPVVKPQVDLTCNMFEEIPNSIDGYDDIKDVLDNCLQSLKNMKPQTLSQTDDGICIFPSLKSQAPLREKKPEANNMEEKSDVTTIKQNCKGVEFCLTSLREEKPFSVIVEETWTKAVSPMAANTVEIKSDVEHWLTSLREEKPLSVIVEETWTKAVSPMVANTVQVKSDVARVQKHCKEDWQVSQTEEKPGAISERKTSANEYDKKPAITLEKKKPDVARVQRHCEDVEDWKVSQTKEESKAISEKKTLTKEFDQMPAISHEEKKPDVATVQKHLNAVKWHTLVREAKPKAVIMEETLTKADNQMPAVTDGKEHDVNKQNYEDVEKLIMEEKPMEQFDVSDDSALQLDPDVEVINTDNESSTLNVETPFHSTPVLARKKRKKWSINNFVLKKRKVRLGKDSTKSHKNLSSQKRIKGPKPHRPCMFCGVHSAALSRHISTVHKKEDIVKKAMEKPKKERLRMFDSFKKLGIEKFNFAQLNEDNPKFYRERKQSKSESDLVKCSNCKGFYGTRYWIRHVRDCGNGQSVPIKLSSMKVTEQFTCSDEFRKHIVNKIRDDPVGDLCRSDRVILDYGKHSYDRIKRRHEKQEEVRKSVRSELRRIAHLYMIFKMQNVKTFFKNSSDMLKRENFLSLKAAIEHYTTRDDDTLKASLKSSIYYLLKNFAKCRKGILLIHNQDADAKAIDDFLTVLELAKDHIFGEAQQAIHKKRQIRLRRPMALPLEDDIKALRGHILAKIKQITSDNFLMLDTSAYIELRDASCARLTLFNARRGGEAARLLLSEWEDAKSDAWIDSQRVEAIEDPIEKKLMSTLKITYQMGKGNFKLVPVLIPEDVQKALIMLADKKIRKDVGISDQNKYLFPSTQGSECHASGWHVIQNLCSKLELKSSGTITATKQRHRVSTLFASLELSKSDREAIFTHLGHSEDINVNVYQAPAAIREITKVGKHLTDMDKGENDVIHPQMPSETSISNSALTTSNESSSAVLKETYQHKNDSSVILPKNYTNKTVIQQEQKDYCFRMRTVNKSKPEELQGDYEKVPRKRKFDMKCEEDLNDSSDENFEILNPSEEEESSSDGYENSQNKPKGIAQGQRRRGRPRKATREALELNQRKAASVPSRVNFVWSDVLNGEIRRAFKCYIHRKAEKAMPSRKVMEDFIIKHNLPLTYDSVRVKIVNERTRCDKLKLRREINMNI